MPTLDELDWLEMQLDEQDLGVTEPHAILNFLKLNRRRKPDGHRGW
jgi:hypothetical protein